MPEILIRSINKTKTRQDMLKVKNKAGNKAGNKTEVKKSVNTYLKKAKLGKFSLVEAEKNMLKDLILRKNMSIYDAAVTCNIDTCKAYSRLFSRKPSEQQFNRAFEIYDKGLSMTTACVASGVSLEHFAEADKKRASNKYNPYRW